MPTIAIRREDKHYERRAPLTPGHLEQLAKDGVDVVLQPAAQRVFSAEEYSAAGARMEEDLSPYQVICGVKEIEPDLLLPNKTYVFFSHTIKGQPQNMALLARLLELGCTLIDYERITDERGLRLVFFGRFAGLAGMIDSLWVLGRRLAEGGVDSPFAALEAAHSYDALEEAQRAISRAGDALRANDPPAPLRPLVIGIAGTGNTAQGAGEILDSLGAHDVTPGQLRDIPAGDPGIYRVFFDVHHLVSRYDGGFDLGEYFSHPHRYHSIFHRWLPHLTVLMSCIYWEQRFPRLVRLHDLFALYDGQRSPRLQVIGDVSCDVGGGIEATLRATWQDDPVYVYDVAAGTEGSGFRGNGPAILAVTNLPTELPRDASVAFGDQLSPFLPEIAGADYDKPLDECGLSDRIRRAVIAHRGELTEEYRYLEQSL